MRPSARRGAGHSVLCAWVILAALTSPASAADTSLDTRILRAKRKVLPALVHIKPVQEFFVGGQRKKRLATGSGVIISREGYVVTNSHVIGKGERIVCVLADEREVPATVVGSDPYTDLAVLKLDEDVLGGKVPFARFGDSDRLERGQFVLALGSPFGLEQTVSAGVISTTKRAFSRSNIGRFNTWIQTDAAINPGNSGGPLVDLRGRIVGINSRGMVGTAENIGFAIPGNLVKEVSAELIASGSVQRTTLGISFQSIDSVRGFFAWENGERPTGALINGVERAGPAAKAGIKPGAILVAIDGMPVDGRYDEHIPPLRKRISELRADTPVTLRLLRDGQAEDMSVTPELLDVFYADEFQLEDWGLTLTAVTDSLLTQYQLENHTGAHVASSAGGKPGHVAGLRQGDVIYFMDRTPVEDLEHFKELYGTAIAERRERILLEVRNGSFHRFVLVKPTYESEEKDPEPTPAQSEEAATTQPSLPAQEPESDDDPFRSEN